MSKAISYEDYHAYGCPACESGNKKVAIHIQTPVDALLICSECGMGFIVAFDGAKETPNGTVVDHPLKKQTCLTELG